MDKELPESAFQTDLNKAFIRVSGVTLRGEKMLKGSIMNKTTINVEDLADRLMRSGCSYRRETLIGVYRTMVSEIYTAVGQGFNVDFDLGRTEIAVNGAFATKYAPFDPEHHHIVCRLRPSPRLRQVAGHIPGENTSASGQCKNIPRIDEVSLDREPYNKGVSTAPFNVLPAGKAPYLFIYGDRLRLMGDLPGVGITLHCAATGEEYAVAPQDIVINSSTRLCFVPRFEFTPGEWEIRLGTQYNPSYRLYKAVRVGVLPFTIR